MIKIGKLTDYAIVLLSRLSQAGAQCSAQELADKTGVPFPTVAKVLKILAREKMVVSERGALGGYRLTRPATSIVIGEVIEALEGPIAITSCVEGHSDACLSEQICPMRGKWTPLNKAVRQAFYDIKLSDMIHSCSADGEETPKLYQISMPEEAVHADLD
jgi:FeS assembly SUF system regulator